MRGIQMRNREWPQFQWKGHVEGLPLTQIQEALPGWLQAMSEIVGPWRDTSDVWVYVSKNRLEFCRRIGHVGQNTWVVGTAPHTSRGKPGRVEFLTPSQWELHDSDSFAGYFIHELTHVWQHHHGAHTAPVWWLEGLANLVAWHIRPDDMGNVKRASEQYWATLVSQQRIHHLDQMALGLRGFVRRKGYRYPYQWNYGAGMAVLHTLSAGGLQAVLRQWEQGPRAIAATLNQSWSSLGTIPGPLVTEGGSAHGT